jgi:hypothetical protein
VNDNLPDPETSLLLSALAALVLVLAAHVALGWVRAAQRRAWPLQAHGALALASLALGTGLWAAPVLALGSEALAFALGFHAQAVLLLWMGACLAMVPVLAWLAARPTMAAALGAAVIVAGAALAVQMGWVRAAGFRPGVQWHGHYLLLAALLNGVGVAGALWLAYASARSRLGPARQRWRGLASLALGLTLFSAQEITMAAAGLASQVATAYRDQLPVSLLCLAAGAAVPLVLALMALDLLLRRGLLGRESDDDGSTLSPPVHRRGHRHRHRQRHARTASKPL